MTEPGTSDLKLQLIRIEEKLDLLAAAQNQRGVHKRDSAARRRSVGSIVTITLFSVVLVLNWLMLFGSVPAVVELPIDATLDRKRALLLALRYTFVLFGVPLIHWYSPDAAVAIFVGLTAGHLGVRDLAFAFNETAIYRQVYRIAAVISLIAFVGIKLGKRLG